MVSTKPPVAGSRFYAPRGAAEHLWFDDSSEILLSGPAGTGKSRACLEKLHYLAGKYPGMRGLIVRKTRESCTESCLTTFEEKVVEAGHPILASGGQRRMRQSYQYPNGSTLVVGGMDKPSKTLSTEFDVIYVQEAIELAENDWEMLTRPLRNGIMPYQQIIADTNPDAPSHWLKRRCDAGRTLLLESRHEDNPVYWDAEANTWTPAGIAYIAKLDALTGPRKPRLRYGRWVQAEGVVYAEWDAAVHLVDRFDVPPTWPRYWSIDFGFTNPFVWQLWATDPDGRLYLIRQIYLSQTLVEQHARRILAIAAKERNPHATADSIMDLERHAPLAIICDHDAEGRATLEKHLGARTIAARKDIVQGIQAVSGRLRKAGDGKPRLFIMRDSLDTRDPELEDRKRPTSTEGEFDSYIWKPVGLSTNAANLKNLPDEPIDRDNHGMDALRYMCAYFENWGNSTPDAGWLEKLGKELDASKREWKLPDPTEQDERTDAAGNWRKRGIFGR